LTTGAYIFGCAGTELEVEEAAFFRDADPWGFILFARNIESAGQVKRLTHDLRASVQRDAPFLIDQEGGRVQRYRAPIGRDWPAPLDHAHLGQRTIWIRNRLIAAELMELGIDVNCTPCADIARDETHPFLRNRCYGTSADDVIPLVRAAAEGLMAGGVLPVIKHMPGHGRAVVDSHLNLPLVSAKRHELDETDFAPFRALADLPLGMTGHMLFEDIDSERPTTLSPIVLSMLRKELGFDGLLMTDDISMEALGGAVEERCAKSLEAGCDIALHCNGDIAEMQAIAAMCGTLTDAAAERAETALSMRSEPTPIDISALEAELAALTGDTPNAG